MVAMPHPLIGLLGARIRRIRNATRIALHWWHEYRHYRTDTYWRTRFNRKEAARFAWQQTRELMYVEGSGLVWWLPF